MSEKKVIIKGTVILTLAGLISRIIGFFYRIFLSTYLGAHGLGIFQLILPVHAFCISFCSSGIQTSISKYVAEEIARGNRKNASKILKAGLFISLSLSVITALFLFLSSDAIAVFLLDSTECGLLLRLVAISIPLACIHSCIAGYFLGLKNASFPAWGQFIEQLVKLLSFYVLATVITGNNGVVTPYIAVITLILAETGSCLFCIIMIIGENIYSKSLPDTRVAHKKTFFECIKLLGSVTFFLTLNRLMLNFIQSSEAILIPFSLRKFGISSEDALSVYGILTGMALPLIMFPSALINSIALMLMPAIAEANANNNHQMIKKISTITLRFCMYSGFFCIAVFLIYGNELGILLFNNVDSGYYICTLAWICPFFYLSTTLGSILHGLGLTHVTFIHNVISSLIRLGTVIFFVPFIGIKGYLWGILVSQLVTTLLHWKAVRRKIDFSFDTFIWILKPTAAIFISGSFGILLNRFLNIFFVNIMLWKLVKIGLSCITMLTIYSLITLKKELKNYNKKSCRTK